MYSVKTVHFQNLKIEKLKISRQGSSGAIFLNRVNKSICIFGTQKNQMPVQRAASRRLRSIKNPAANHLLFKKPDPSDDAKPESGTL